MKVIDLLNKIANGEEVPRKFTYKGYLWEYDIKNEMWFYYFGEGKSHRFDRLFYLHMCLTDEVEIIEEDKEIEKLKVNVECIEDVDYPLGRFEQHYEQTKDEICEKINELIDELNKLKVSK